MQRTEKLFSIANDVVVIADLIKPSMLKRWNWEDWKKKSS